MTTNAKADDWGDQPDYNEAAPTHTVRPMQPLIQTPPDVVDSNAGIDAQMHRLRTTPERAAAFKRWTENGRRFVAYLPAKHCVGCLDPCYPECPHCGAVSERREIRHLFLETMVRMFTGEAIVIYFGYLSCASCLGAYEGKSAEAVAARRIAELERAGFPLAMRTWTLDTYPVQNSEWLKRAKDYVRQPTADVIIWGNPGTGKTGLGIAILRELWSNRKSVRYIRAMEIMLLLRDSMRPKAFADDTMSEIQILQSFAAVDVLMIDDMQNIKGTDYQDEVMSYMIDMRQKSGKPTILTLNLRVPRNGDPSRELLQFFGDRIFDRMREYGEEWHVSGSSIRRPK